MDFQLSVGHEGGFNAADADAPERSDALSARERLEVYPEGSIGRFEWKCRCTVHTMYNPFRHFDIYFHSYPNVQMIHRSAMERRLSFVLPGTWSIAEAASKHLLSYERAVSLGKQLVSCRSQEERGDKIALLVDAFADHYLPNAVVFGHLQPIVWPTKADAVKFVTPMIGRYAATRLGFNASLKWHRIQVVSDQGMSGSAVCFAVWEYTPLKESGLEPWVVNVVYGFRRKSDGTSGWEHVTVDNEIAERSKRVPNFED